MKAVSKYKQIGRMGFGFTIGNNIPFSCGSMFYDCVYHYYISVPYLLIEFTIE